MITPIVENALTNIVGTSDNTQEEVEHPDVDKNDDDAQHAKKNLLPTPRQKRKIITR